MIASTHLLIAEEPWQRFKIKQALQRWHRKTLRLWGDMCWALLSPTCRAQVTFEGTRRELLPHLCFCLPFGEITTYWDYSYHKLGYDIIWPPQLWWNIVTYHHLWLIIWLVENAPTSLRSHWEVPTTPGECPGSAHHAPTLSSKTSAVLNTARQRLEAILLEKISGACTTRREEAERVAKKPMEWGYQFLQPSDDIVI